MTLRHLQQRSKAIMAEAAAAYAQRRITERLERIAEERRQADAERQQPVGASVRALALALLFAFPLLGEARPVNVNTATAKQLESVQGIGSVLAARIIEARPYEKLDDLRKVKGIGEKRLAQIRPALFVECDTDTDCENRNGVR